MIKKIYKVQSRRYNLFKVNEILVKQRAENDGRNPLTAVRSPLTVDRDPLFAMRQLPTAISKGRKTMGGKRGTVSVGQQQITKN